MDAGIDARVGALPRRLGEAREGSRDPFEGLAAREGEVGLIAAQDTGEDYRGGAAERALRGRIVGDGRGVLMTVPGRVTRGGIVAVVVALADGGDRAPRIVHIADLEARDERVCHCHVHEGQDTGAVPGVEVARGRHRARDGVPGARALEPEARDLRLVGRADRADLAPDVLHLVVVPRVGSAGQCRRPGKPELRCRQQGERRDVSPARNGRGEVSASRVRIGDGRVGRNRVRMWPPLAGTHARRIGRVAGDTVILAQRQHRGTGGAADGHALVPGGAGGDAGDRHGIGLLGQGERGALLSGRAEAIDDTDKHRMGGRGDRGVGRRGRVCGPLEVVGVVLAVDRIQRVVDRPVHHREGAR